MMQISLPTLEGPVMAELIGAAPKLIEDGMIEQVVLTGLPAHPSAHRLAGSCYQQIQIS
jgi:hypothetical protein